MTGRIRPLARAHRRAFIAIVVLLCVSMSTLVGATAWLVHDIVTTLPNTAAIQQVGSMSQATLLLDASDKPAFTIFKEQRIEVPLKQVSPHLVKAIVAIEDQRFYDHGGIDLIRVAGAAFNNLREGRRAQGASTLTQQLARQSFLTPDKTLRRKIKEMIVASRLEREYSKEQILQLYLNKVYFGDGLYGAEAASLGYFGKHASELDAAESALLAGLVKSPSAYAPTVSKARALSRRNLVLQQMRQTGSLTVEEYDRARNEPLMLTDALRREEGFGLYFKEEVRRQLVDRFGWERVYQGGLKVFTTIDPVMQKAAEEEVARGLVALERRQKRPAPTGEGDEEEDPLQAALVSLDPHTGAVRALVGGRDFTHSSFNRVVQAHRQPGSAFKPFVYAAAIEAGYSPGSVLTDLDQPIATPEGDWVPEDEHTDTPTMTMRAALRTSSNRAAVRMLEQVGIPETVGYAKRFGVGAVPAVPSLALGSGEVTLLSMTGAYGAFANGGMVEAPFLIRRVEDQAGTVLFETVPHGERAVRETTAFLVSSMLADVINSGTGWTARREGFTLPAAGKTGTTNDYHDAWFVGYTPTLVTGVWVGYDHPKTIVRNGYAAEVAVPIWSRFMKVATKRDPSNWIETPATITTATICRLSGRLAGEGCRDAVIADPNGGITRGSLEYTEYFVRGTEPTDYCPLHGREHGQVVVDNEDVAPRPGTPATLGANNPVPEPSAPPPAKKKGFWGRIFGR